MTNELTYTKNGEYWIPDLTAAEQPMALSKYGRMREMCIRDRSRNGAEQKKPNTTAAIWRKNADNGENSGNGSRSKSPINFPLSQTRKEKRAHEKID